MNYNVYNLNHERDCKVFYTKYPDLTFNMIDLNHIKSVFGTFNIDLSLIELFKEKGLDQNIESLSQMLDDIQEIFTINPIHFKHQKQFTLLLLDKSKSIDERLSDMEDLFTMIGYSYNMFDKIYEEIFNEEDRSNKYVINSLIIKHGKYMNKLMDYAKEEDNLYSCNKSEKKAYPCW